MAEPSPRRRVVVTGLGAISPHGAGADRYWSAVAGGEVVTRPSPDWRGPFEQVAVGTVPDDVEAALGARFGEALSGRSARFALGATDEALRSAGVLERTLDRGRIGVAFGVVIGTRPGVERAAHRGAGWSDPSVVSAAPAAHFGLGGPNAVVATACAAGNSAIAWGAELVAGGSVDGMVVGGADELSMAMLAMFASFKSLARDGLRPFDARRDGLVLAEGGAALFLEAMDTAVADGVTPLAEVRGASVVADAHHMTAPHPEGAGARRSMAEAIERAGLRPQDVDLVCAHGTGTPANDLVEARAIQHVFGTDIPPVTGVKGGMGHAQGAASAFEAIACVRAITDGIVPPTAQHEQPDPELGALPVVTGVEERPVDVVLNNAFGFGGNVCCVVFGSAAR